MGLRGVSFILPCLNEAETLAQAIKEAKIGLLSINTPGEIIVADNGSTDGSQKIAEAYGAKLIEVPVRGYGATIDAGVKASQYSVITYADADLSYPLRDIGLLTNPILEDKADVTLGSRFNGIIDEDAMPFLNRYIGTPFLSALIRARFGLLLSDCNSGMRALRRQVYDLLDLKCQGMEFASEMLIKVSKNHFRYCEIPIHFQKDKRSREPHLRRWRDGLRHLNCILENSWTSLLP